MTVGVGDTTILNVSGVPRQPFNDGVAMITAVCCVATAEVIWLKSPVPLAGRPKLVFEFVQLTTVPAGFAVKLTVVVCVAQRLWSAVANTEGVGFTTTWNVIGVPLQPLRLGVTVIFAV